MLYIIAKIDGKEIDEIWWVDSARKPWESLKDITIVAIQANGDELQYIRDHFINIPMLAMKRTAIWKGEFARFIYDNLTAKK